MVALSLTRELDSLNINYKTDFCVKDTSTFHIGGICPLAVFPSTEKQLVDTLSLLDSKDISFRVIGRASNTLFFDGTLDSVIVFTAGVCEVSVEQGTVTAGAGVGLVALSRQVCDAGLSGLEFACGIPASIGGAVFMNAGAHGGSMADVLTQSRAYDRKSGRVLTLLRESHEFGYRSSIYMKDPSLVCLGATISLTAADRERIRQDMSRFTEARRKSQPTEKYSAGSYFKRPVGDFAGRLIEACGLKGVCVGDAQVSTKHAGFIINRGSATFDDVMRLEERVIQEVLLQTGVLLEREVEIVR